MTLSMGIEAITGFTPINLYLQKIRGRLQLRVYSLPSSHILCSLMSSYNEFPLYQHPLSLNSLTKRQHGLVKGHLVDMDNCFNEAFSSFDPINPELFPGHRIIDIFSNCFLFQPFNKQVNCNITSWVQELDRIAIKSLESPLTALIILDASVKNNIATSIAHIHIRDRPIMKTLHYTLNITSIKAKLVAIRCSINQAIDHNFISTIIIVMDLIHAAKKIFDLFSYPFQKHMVSILKELHSFFSCHPDNHIEFWKCPSHSKWHLHKAVDCQVWFTLEWKSIEWTQKWVDLWNNLGFSLYAVLSVCCIVATSDDGKKSKIGVSTDWCVAIEHQGLSSIRVIFIDYQTSKLQCNY